MLQAKGSKNIHGGVGVIPFVALAAYGGVWAVVQQGRKPTNVPKITTGIAPTTGMNVLDPFCLLNDHSRGADPMQAKWTKHDLVTTLTCLSWHAEFELIITMADSLSNSLGVVSLV